MRSGFAGVALVGGISQRSCALARDLKTVRTSNAKRPQATIEQQRRVMRKISSRRKVGGHYPGREGERRQKKERERVLSLLQFCAVLTLTAKLILIHAFAFALLVGFA